MTCRTHASLHAALDDFGWSNRHIPAHLRFTLALLACAVAPALPAQGIVSGRAVLPNSARPLMCTDATLRRTDGTVVARTFTREDGTFEFLAPATGRYVVAFRTLGMIEAVAPLDSLHPGSDVDRVFTVPLDAVDSLVERVEAERSDARYAQPVRNTGIPRYPDAERASRRSGGVVAAIVVRPDGRVDSAMTSVLYASAEPFETAVREALGKMRFTAALLDGQPRCSLLVQPFIFEVASAGNVGDIAPLPPKVITPLPVERRGVCPPLPEITDESPPVYLACQVDREAREARSSAQLNWFPTVGEVTPTSCFRAEVRFIVDSLGYPEPGTATLVSTNNRGFGEAVLALIPDLRYQPGRLKGRPVRQVVTLRESVGVVTVLNTGQGVGSSTPSRRTRC